MKALKLSSVIVLVIVAAVVAGAYMYLAPLFQTD